MSQLILPRRKFLTGLVSFLAAPAIVRASSLMPVKVYKTKLDIVNLGTNEEILKEAVRIWSKCNKELMDITGYWRIVHTISR